MASRFSIIQPATGDHAWDVTEGWSKALRRMGLLKREFKPKAKWNAQHIDDDDGLLEYLRTGPKEYFLLLGFDWHSQPLHYGEPYELLRLRRDRNIAVIWEDYLAEEHLLDGITEKMRAAWNRSKGAFRLAISNHESNIKALTREPDSPSVSYIGFGIDMERFKLALPGGTDKINRIYFSGKLSEWSHDKQGGPYALRRKILSHLEQSNINVIYSQGKQTDLEYCRSLIRSTVCLNLPSLSLSPTLRNYEALAAESILLTWKPESPSYIKELRLFPNVFFYDPFRLEELGKTCIDLLNIESSNYEKLISLGSQHLHLLSHENRIQQVLKLLQQQSTSKHRLNTNSSKCIVVDLVFLQIARNGIAYVWDSILKSYIKMFGPESLVLIQRSKNLLDNYGCRVIKADPVDWNDSPDNISKEIDDLLIEHGVFDYCFASSYYTYSSNQPSLQLIHDMIPELLGGTEPVWRHKSESLKNSEMILCVSRTTRNDLIAFRPDYRHKIRIALNGMPIKHIQATLVTREHMPPPENTYSDFTILYLGGRYGYLGYKNAIVLFKAFKKFLTSLPKGKTSKILCVSHTTEPEPQIQEIIKGLPIEFIEASDNQLSAIMKDCHCLVYPSAIEGFGLPIIESAYHGIHVIASNVLAHREADQLAANCVTFFPTFDSTTLAELMGSISQKSLPRHSDSHRLRMQSITEASYRRWDSTAQTLHGFLHNQYSNEKSLSFVSNYSWLKLVQRSFKFKKNSLRYNIERSWGS